MKTCYVCNCEIKDGEPFFNRIDGTTPTHVHDDCLMRAAEFEGDASRKSLEGLMKREPWRGNPTQLPGGPPPVQPPKMRWRLHVIPGGFWLDSIQEPPNKIRRFFYKWLLGWRVEDL